MLLLAIETASEAAQVALADDSGTVASAALERGRRHGETVAPAVSFVLGAAQVPAEQLDAVVVDVGPGLFTGLRVGIATATMLAAAIDRPVVMASSLEVLATAALKVLGHGSRDVTVVAVVDAKRGEVFWAPFGRSDLEDDELIVAHQLDEDQVSPPGELAAGLRALTAKGDDVVLVGDGALRYRSELDSVPIVGASETDAGRLVYPPVETLCAIGRRRYLAGETVAADAVVPRYLRGADVRINWEQRAPRAAVSGAAGESAG